MKFLNIAPLMFLSFAAAFFTNNKACNYRLTNSLSARKKEAEPEAPIFIVGEDVPSEILSQNAIYDMILVERFSAPEKTDFGLFLPSVEGKDKKHLGKVLSVPTSYGLESENGRLQTIQEIAPYKVGDVVFIKDPWGVGPKDQVVGKRCFSFHKAAHVISLTQ